LVTVIDEGRWDMELAHGHGCLSIDDEGTPTQRTTLIEQGRMTGHMSDRLNARLMGKTSSGNGRRQSYAHLPMPRMTNTYMMPGDSTFEDMIGGVDKGVYAVGFNGGQVDIVSGNFVFSTSEAYEIVNGKLGQPLKGATLIGNGPAVMQQVKAVGHDLVLDPGVGYCGKNGQTVIVGLGQPSCLVDGMTVGGTQVS
jgi:TldD protein